MRATEMRDPPMLRRVLALVFVLAGGGLAFAKDPVPPTVVRCHGGDAVLRGRVVDPKGQPVPGAEVKAFETAVVLRDGTDAVRTTDVDVPSDEGRAVTSADGGFEIAGLSAVEHGIRVDSPGHGIAVLLGCSAAPGGGPPVEVTLGSAVAVEGDVVDANGKGVADVAVAAKPASLKDPGDLRDYAVLGRAIGRSDAQGRFRIGGIPAAPHGRPLEGIFVFARSTDGAVTAMRLLAKPPFADRAACVLAGSASVEGTVLDAETRTPLPGARITLLVGGEGDAGRSTWVTTTADDHGAFRREGLPPGPLMAVCVLAKDFGALLDSPAKIALGPGAATRLDVPVHRGRSVGGQVQAPDGAPLKGVEILAYRRDALFAAVATTDDAGRFRIDGLPWQDKADGGSLASLRLCAPGLFARDPRSLTVTPSKRSGPVVRADLHLVRAWSVSGRVLDAAGNPIAGAWVEPSEIDPRRGAVDELSGATSGRDGGFLIRGLPFTDLHLKAHHAALFADVVKDVHSAGDGATLQGVEIRFAEALPAAGGAPAMGGMLAALRCPRVRAEISAP